MSEIPQKVIQKSPESPQKVVRKSSKCIQEVIRKSSVIHQKFLKKSTESPLKLLWLDDPDILDLKIDILYHQTTEFFFISIPSGMA